MSYFEILFLAVILSIDAFCLSFSYGLSHLKRPVKVSVKIALGTGFSQFIMPLIGAYFTNMIYDYIQNYAKYLAGGIFIALGIKIITEALGSNEKQDTDKIFTEDISLPMLFSISVATSIDALAAGTSLYLLKAPVFAAAVTIGLITFINSLTGFYLGKLFKNLASGVLNKLGGLILIILGLKSIFL